MRLQLFAESGGGEGAAQGEGAASAALPQRQDADNPSSERTDIPRQEGAPDSGGQQDRMAEFDRLIRGQYKAEYDRRVQDHVRGSRETAAKYTALMPALELLAKRYGVDAADAGALSRAIAQDPALRAGEGQQQAQRDAGRQDPGPAARMEAQRQALANRQYALWARQAEEAKTLYPALDLGAEAKNPRFRQLLGAGVDVGSAYLVLHKDDILPAAMQHTAKVVEKKLADKIIAAGARPAENGVSAQAPAVTKRDVSQLTKADREEIRRRAAAGDRIRF